MPRLTRLAGAEGAETPQDQTDHHDDFPRVGHKNASLVYHGYYDIIPAGSAIHRQFKDKIAFLLQVDEPFGDITNDHGHQQAQHIQTHHYEALEAEDTQDVLSGDRKGDQNGINRQAGAAAHQGSDEDGQKPFLPVLDAAGTHDGRDGTGEAADHGHDALPVQPDF